MLRKLVILVLPIICITFGCERWIFGPGTPQRKVPFETLLKDARTFHNHTLSTAVLRSEKEERLFVQQFAPARPLPEVDYSDSMVIALLSGESGVSVSASIDSIIITTRGLTVYSTVFYPSLGLPAVGYPAHLVTLRTRWEPVNFAPTDIVCEWKP